MPVNTIRPVSVPLFAATAPEHATMAIARNAESPIARVTIRLCARDVTSVLIRGTALGDAHAPLARGSRFRAGRRAQDQTNDAVSWAMSSFG